MKFKCEHCGLKFDETQLIDDNGHKFCCNGCKQVYNLLRGSGLDAFYDKLGATTLNPANMQEIPQNCDEIYKNYVKNTSDGFREIYIVIENIHCSACVWLNEKVLSRAEGILEVAINGTTNKARIVWDETQISLSQIFTLIGSIGYNALPYDATRSEVQNTAKRHKFYMKLLVGLFATMNIMWIAVALYSGYYTGIDAKTKDILHFAEFILATPVLFYTGSEFFKGAFNAIKSRVANMDLLVCAGASLTYFYSVFVMFSRRGETYFESVCMIITFIFIGKYLEAITKKRAADTLDSLSNFVLNDVEILRDGKGVFLNPREILVDDEILIKPGAKTLIDGEIISGEGRFDYSEISGESAPVFCAKGDKISSGATCIDGQILYRAGSDFENSFLNKIINLLENATLNKPKIEKIANEISGKFSLVILALAVVTFAFWFIKADFQSALVACVCVVVIACPCALGLATPTASIVGLGVGLKKRVIFKEARIIESLAKCKVVVFDKTGTLTKSRLRVVNFVNFKEFDEKVLVALLRASGHIVSRAVMEFCDLKFGRNLDISSSNLILQNIKNIQARGISAEFDGRKFYGGSAKFMSEIGFTTPKTQKTNYFFADEDGICAGFELEDEIRAEAGQIIDALKSMKFEIFLLSGDNLDVVSAVAKELKIEHFYAQMLPDEKANFVQNLIKNGKKVVMVGDGINDAIALKCANVGVAMGHGADVSLGKSDVVLLDDDLHGLLNAVKISRQTLLHIKQNLGFSLVYNAIFVPVAMIGAIIPLFAALAMSASSIIVVLNSLRIKMKFKG